MVKKNRFVAHCLSVTILLLLGWLNPTHAQQNPILTRAEVYKLLNAVQLLLANQNPRPARRADVLRPLDALQTKARSQAELLFNEGSFLRIGSNAVFRFKPGLRRIQLKNGQVVAEAIFELRSGTVVAITPPGSSGTTVEMPGAGKVESGVSKSGPPTTDETRQFYLKSGGDSFAVSYDGVKKIALVANLGINEIKVFNLDGTQFRVLKGGEAIDINQGVLGNVRVFDLERFYATTKLAAGLGPGQAGLLLNESPQVQEIFRLVRKDTIAAYQAQKGWIEGLCNINGRGVASTLSTNCINTNADDPLRTFEDRRDVIVPEPQTPETREPELPQDIPPQDIPTQDIPTQDIPTQDIPTQDIPTQDNPPVDTPVIDNPVINDDIPVDNQQQRGPNDQQ